MKNIFFDARQSGGPIHFWWIFGERGLAFQGKYKTFEKSLRGDGGGV